ncbi:hypothetical protein Ocin01_16938 [Orchesella cincta]|uniref:Uncharacterized protein n=1 Tax=Orchesella cincta TaxID=48709 RepID=A0A1D2MA25_ORCCI|nr:hypothetical protein Ocin01_16938 [Orchesella cincta]
MLIGKVSTLPALLTIDTKESTKPLSTIVIRQAEFGLNRFSGKDPWLFQDIDACSQQTLTLVRPVSYEESAITQFSPYKKNPYSPDILGTYLNKITSLLMASSKNLKGCEVKAPAHLSHCTADRRRFKLFVALWFTQQRNLKGREYYDCHDMEMRKAFAYGEPVLLDGNR